MRRPARGLAPVVAPERAIAPALAITLALALVLALSACSRSGAAKPARRVAIATIYPVYDFARRIAGDRFEVKMLLPPGVEPHEYDPKPGDIATVAKADLFLYTNDLMEPWARGMASGAGKPSQSTAAPEGEDPHVWLDPILAQGMADAIAAGMARADPEGAPAFAANALALRERLAGLDAKARNMLAAAPRREIVFGGHNTFGLFAKRYGLVFLSPYRNFSPDSEPGAGSIADLLATMKRSGDSTVFYGELLEPRVARMLAQEGGARLELLHGLHGLTKEEAAAGKDYFVIMEENIVKLAKALGAAEQGTEVAR